MKFYPCRSFVIPLLAYVVMSLPVSGLTASSSDYEIPLSDLKKVEKKNPKKTEQNYSKKRRKSEKIDRKTSSDAAASSAPSVLPESTLREPSPVSLTEKQELQLQSASGQPPDTATPVAAEGAARISHDPYSYVVTGKRTVLKAIVSSREGIAAVRCQFKATGGGGYAQVTMTKVEGSRFMYSATLPALAKGVLSLHYRFVAVDSPGKESRSQEYVIPVKEMSVVPGWQQEPTQEVIEIGNENHEKPLEGFSDIIVEDLLK